MKNLVLAAVTASFVIAAPVGFAFAQAAAPENRPSTQMDKNGQHTGVDVKAHAAAHSMMMHRSMHRRMSMRERMRMRKRMRMHKHMMHSHM